MRLFLMVAAMLVALANATLYSLSATTPFDNLFDLATRPLVPLPMYAFSAVFVGLLISGTLLNSPEESCAIPSSPATA